MNICVVGCGYVGLTTGAVLAQFKHNVTCVDTNENKILQLSKGLCPFHENGLEELIQKEISDNRLSFSTDTQLGMHKNEVIIIAVGTPSCENGQTDLSYVNQVISDLAETFDQPKVIIIKSTVPPGTNDSMKNSLIELGVNKEKFSIISNPEFLREGNALDDLLHPDKIVVGGDQPEHLELIRKLYDYTPSTYFFTTPVCAEIIKYTSNAFLATKISFINEIAKVCDAFGANVNTVADAIGTDPRIGPHFLKAGIGYGGYCLPKDIKSLCYAANDKGVKLPLLHAVEETNNSQVDLYIKKIETELGSVRNLVITVWGLSFKSNTDDLRDSPSIRLIEKLIEQGAIIKGYDPMANPESPSFIYYDNLYDSVIESDVLIIATDCNEFTHADWKKVKQHMRGNLIVDARNCIDPTAVRSLKLKYVALGG
ncbi:UDP-glucose/GDP-mannose dehydrogenase family protein [Alkalihalobacillus sp. AL-G]|uniref:UDP-glucose dehydrogenase family protein n=1 Tax=Alkalihalobacillus sp. AL-G TaxID=2926399 RepID=UPI00272A5C6C|nr:UDP-glucose/GDP-mannose dehydrogenase family protein [Alkalihalobacillus sp. AL-G]WLD94966.1 UDP-glucose/GDP-mannose dehydrogenase family protein [Alkalihalobacillus sp. AL-G]